MALFSRLVRLKPYFSHRQFSAIAKPDPKTLFAHKQKIKTVLSLLGTKNNNPAEQILYLALSDAVSSFPHSESSSGLIPSFLHELKTQPSLLCSLLDELKARPDLQKERFFCYFFTLYGQAGMFDNAVQTFKDMTAMNIDPSTDSLNVLLRAGLHKSTTASEVIKVFNEFSHTYDIIADVETYNILLEGLVPLGYYNSRETICSLLDQMESDRCIPDDTTSSIFMDGLHKENLEDAAQVILDIVDRDILLLDARVYNFGIESLCKLKKTREALNLFETVTSQDVKPNANNYQHLIHLCIEEGNLQEFYKLHKHMREGMGIEIDRSCYATLIANLCKYGYYETAYMACKECISEKWFADAFLSDPTTIKSLMHGLVWSSNYKLVVQLNELMEKNGVRADLEFYNYSIGCLCEMGRSVEAKALFEGLEAKDLKPDATTYQHLISAFSKRRLFGDGQEAKILFGDVQEAKRLFGDVNNKGLKLNADTYERLIDVFGWNGKFEDVRDLYKDMCEKEVKPTRCCYESLIKYLIYGGYYDTALDACKSCMSEIWFLDAFIPTHVFLNELSKISKHDDVLKLLDLSKKHGLNEDISICNTGIYAMCRLKKLTEASALFEAMVSRGIEPNAYAYACLISMCAREGDTEEVMRLYHVMREKGVELDGYSYETIFKCLFQDGDTKNALQVCKNCMGKEWFEDFFFSSDASTMKKLLSLVLFIAKDHDTPTEEEI